MLLYQTILYVFIILWAFEYIAHVGLFFPLQKKLVLISDSDYTLLKQLCWSDDNVTGP